MKTTHASKIIVGTNAGKVTMAFHDDGGREIQRLSMTPQLATQISELLRANVNVLQVESGGVIDLIRNVDILGH